MLDACDACFHLHLLPGLLDATCYSPRYAWLRHLVSIYIFDDKEALVTHVDFYMGFGGWFAM